MVLMNTICAAARPTVRKGCLRRLPQHVLRLVGTNNANNDNPDRATKPAKKHVFYLLFWQYAEQHVKHMRFEAFFQNLRLVRTFFQP